MRRHEVGLNRPVKPDLIRFLVVAFKREEQGVQMLTILLAIAVLKEDQRDTRTRLPRAVQGLDGDLVADEQPGPRRGSSRRT
jgi:hypothetical protein